MKPLKPCKGVNLKGKACLEGQASSNEGRSIEVEQEGRVFKLKEQQLKLLQADTFRFFQQQVLWN